MKRKFVIGLGLGVLFLAVAAFTLIPRGGPRRMRAGGAAEARPAIESSEGSKPEESSSQQESTPEAPKLVSKTDSGSDLAWSRFRGTNGTGISLDKNIPTEWNDEKNLKWKLELPGAGSSSPVLTNQFVFVTSYSGYGEDRSGGGDVMALKRHVTCVDREKGTALWTRTIEAKDRDDPYQGMGLPEHGYATNSPVTDGTNVYAFLGKSGVYAFSSSGQELWHTSVGTESGNRGWGTASSLVLYDDLVIVNASEESQAIYALNKSTGEVVWKSPASTLELAYGTPVIVSVDASRDDLVIAVPGEVWGLNPKTGKLIWYVETSMTDNLSPSVIVDGDRLYAFGGYRSSGSMAIRIGGKGDVSKSHVIWTSRTTSYVATPVLVEKRLYWIDDKGMYFCQNAETGELIERARVSGMTGGGRPVYASPIAVDNKIYVQSRSSGMFVLAPESKLRILAQNQIASDDTIFNATPAVDRGQLFLRSGKALYCISQ